MKQEPKQRHARINILGKETFILPIVQEDDRGFLCRTSPNDGPATEWFAKNSQQVTSREINHPIN